MLRTILECISLSLDVSGLHTCMVFVCNAFQCISSILFKNSRKNSMYYSFSLTFFFYARTFSFRDNDDDELRPRVWSIHTKEKKRKICKMCTSLNSVLADGEVLKRIFLAFFFFFFF